MRFYRAAIAIYWVAMLGIPIAIESQLMVRDDVPSAVSGSDFHGAVLTVIGIRFWFWLNVVANTVGAAGLWFFWSGGRSIFFLMQIANVIVTPLLGVWVVTPLEATISAAAYALLLWLMCVSYAAPFSGRFELESSFFYDTAPGEPPSDSRIPTADDPPVASRDDRTA